MYSCNSSINNCNYTTYTIKENKHNANNRIPSLININEGISGKFSINTYSTEYDHINKIVGFSIGNQHHNNSVRIGWMYNNNKVDLYYYIYHNEIRYYEFIKTVNLNQLIDYTIYIQDNLLYLYIDNQLINTDFTFDSNYGYILYPYHGGINKADNDITINLKICT